MDGRREAVRKNDWPAHSFPSRLFPTKPTLLGFLTRRSRSLRGERTRQNAVIVDGDVSPARQYTQVILPL